MAEQIEMDTFNERVILIGVCMADNDDTMDSLDELEDLVTTAGAETVGRLIQNRAHSNPATYVGKGKLEEIQDLIVEQNATGIVCDDELSPAQIRNMEAALNTKIMDRTLIILDIFASRAVTKEGKIQVELAQLRYRLSRLSGLGKSLSRLGGGIGTRGPGEKKLEMDRRFIRNRISQLKEELEDVKRHRSLTRSRRSKNHLKVAAIVGYTNAGKSTLLNRLTQAGVLAEDKLFATLDPTTRKLSLESGQEILLTDTVGFIRKLPHHLIEAFKSTLEEAKYADFILHVVDASSPQREKQMHIVYEILDSLGASDKQVITLFNKQDQVTGRFSQKDFRAEYSLRITARTGEGFTALMELLERVLREDKLFLEKVFSYDQAGRIQMIRQYGELLEEEFREEGIYVKSYVPKELYEKIIKDF